MSTMSGLLNRLWGDVRIKNAGGNVRVIASVYNCFATV